MVVLQNILTSLFNSHLFDFHKGWMYGLGSASQAAWCSVRKRTTDVAVPEPRCNDRRHERSRLEDACLRRLGDPPEYQSSFETVRKGAKPCCGLAKPCCGLVSLLLGAIVPASHVRRGSRMPDSKLLACELVLWLLHRRGSRPAGEWLLACS